MHGDLKPKTQIIIPGKTGHLFSVIRVASFHHSPRFASSSFDGTVRIWEGEQQENVLFYFSEAIEGLEITPDDEKIIVVLGDSSKAYLYNLKEEQLHEIGGDIAFRNLFGTNPSSTKVALTTFDDDVYIYDLTTQKLGARLFVENVSGNSLIWINNEKICIPKRNGNVAIINSEKRTIEQEVPVHDGLIVSICRDGDNIVTVSEDGTGRILDLDFKPLLGFKIDFTPISVDYSAQAGIAAVAGERKLLIVNTSTGDLLSHDQSLSGSNAVITSDSKIIKGTGERDISIFTQTGEKSAQIDGRSHTAEFVSFLSEDVIVFASGDNSVHKLSYSTREDEPLAAHKETVSSVLIIPSRKYVIAGAYDDTISIYDISNHKEVKRIKKVPLVTALAGSPSEDIFIAACGGDNTLHVFTAEGQKQTNWAAHDDFISSVLFMNDEVIVSGADDGIIKFWKRNGKLISKIETNSPIRSIGTTLEFDYNVTGHQNGDIILWEKISNRKISSYNVSLPIQRILVIDNSLLFFAAQNRLFQMGLDGRHITDVQEVCRHTEPIRGIHWQAKPEKVITVAHSIEIFETAFVKAELISPPLEELMTKEVDEASTTVIFSPGEMEEEVVEPETTTEVPVSTSTEVEISTTDLEHLTKISDYLETISQQIKELVVPELESAEIDSSALIKSLDEVQKDLKRRLEGQTETQPKPEELKEEPPPEEEKPDWTSIDWGKRR
ncbi:MAG: hypothetical protein JSV04_12055 [Candidatus Heimdallarchaeota archaeon]|nr:MAG: hypothetical protein JSV04_12055 [Candidatus Heimdallarchaeota archaeon]